MALLDLWRLSQTQLESKRVHQVLAVAGTGKLQDGSDTSAEFRAFLGQVPSRVLTQYAADCLTEKFEQSGFALQDVINEIGRRLGFGVENGRYRGMAGQSGHDGLWSTVGRVFRYRTDQTGQPAWQGFDTEFGARVDALTHQTQNWSSVWVH